MLRPPFWAEKEGRTRAIRSIEYTFDVDVPCCAVVPTRGGNGIMERLSDDGLFASPFIGSM